LKERNSLGAVKKGKINSIGHIQHKNCLLKYGIEGKIEGEVITGGKRGRRIKQLLDDLRKREDTDS